MLKMVICEMKWNPKVFGFARLCYVYEDCYLIEVDIEHSYALLLYLFFILLRDYKFLLIVIVVDGQSRDREIYVLYRVSGLATHEPVLHLYCVLTYWPSAVAPGGSLRRRLFPTWRCFVFIKQKQKLALSVSINRILPPDCFEFLY